MPWRKTLKPGEPGNRTRREWYLNVPTRHGGRVVRSARTTDLKTAKRYEAMLADIGSHGSREFDLLDRVVDGDLTLAELCKAWRANDLASLRERQDDIDLEPLVAAWKADMNVGVVPATRDNYHAAVRALIPAGTPFRRSELTPARLAQWMSEMGGAAATRHYRLSALKKFIWFLIQREVLRADPSEGISRPKLPPPRVHYLATADVIRLVDQQPSPFREFSAFIHGTAADVSDALEQVRVRDVDRAHREVFINGDKRESRSRYVRVADWAWPYVESLVEGKQPDALVFDPAVIDRFKQWREHTKAVTALVDAGFHVYQGYVPKDSRHTFAVRLVRAGVPLQVVAEQLGHKDVRMVAKVYGRYVPRRDERERWERKAALIDGVFRAAGIVTSR